MKLEETFNEAEGKLEISFGEEGTEVAHILTRENTDVVLYVSEDGDLVRLEVLFSDDD